MTKMKESGIDWIGQIPQEWEVTRIKNIVSIERGASPRPIDKFISDDGTGVNWIRIGDTYKGNKYITSTKLKITNRGKQFSRYIHPGTLILSNSMSFGEPYISSIYGCIHDGWLSLAPNNNISKEYLYWLLLSDVCTSQFNLVSIGAVVENLSVDKVGNTLVSMPYSLSEQQKIADFLDKKTAQLDKVKALLEEQIQKLKDYRASLIHETVTKGLDKTVPMKDSGIDWIGQVPQGWGVSRLKYYFDIYAGGDIDERNTVEEYSESHPYPVLSNSLENEGVLGYTNKYRFKKNCVTVTGRGDVGKAVYRNINFYPVVRLLVCVPKSQVDCRFVTYWINSAIIEKNQTAVSQLTIQMLGELLFVNVPFLVQKNIADFLDKETIQIDKLIQIKNQQIENINKQRQTLIYDYVTGKRRM